MVGGSSATTATGCCSCCVTGVCSRAELVGSAGFVQQGQPTVWAVAQIGSASSCEAAQHGFCSQQLAVCSFCFEQQPPSSPHRQGCVDHAGTTIPTETQAKRSDRIVTLAKCMVVETRKKGG